jgi:hypothetical protein
MPIFFNFVGDNPLKFVVSANLHRRHLDESQRGMVAARMKYNGRRRTKRCKFACFSDTGGRIGECHKAHRRQCRRGFRKGHT